MHNFLAVEKRTGFWLWLLLILLTAVALRFYHLTIVPPGLTHDEADHGITAVAILNGARDIYFTIGHGREPLYARGQSVRQGRTGLTRIVAGRPPGRGYRGGGQLPPRAE